MPLSATLTTNGVGRDAPRSKASPTGAGSTNTIQSLVPNTNSSAPFSATEALQAALTVRYASSALRLQQGQAPPAEAGATAALQASQSAQVVMSTIGFGIDLGHGGNSSWNATEASVRALRDAMERSTLRLPYLSTLSDKQLQLRVKLGVPPKNSLQPTEPMAVDLAAVAAVLPRSIPLDAPIQVVVGGLAVPGSQGGEPPVCAAIASVSIQTVSDSTPFSAAQRAMEPWSQQLASLEAQEEQKPAAKPTTTATATTASQPGRVDSMSMLARISSAVRDNPSIVSGNGNSPLAAAVAAVNTSMDIHQERKPSVDLTMAATEEDTSTEASSQGETAAPQRKRSSRQMQQHQQQQQAASPPKSKLRPGLTALKKNPRQYVQHNYHDHSMDEPLPGEDMAGTQNGDNVAFPFKMHDTLTRIEADGYSDIMSWLPHGRSFKIHDLDGFHDHVLPMYFRHSKKSSLLRQVRVCEACFIVMLDGLYISNTSSSFPTVQLNLYGFRRICAGPDKGSYYHELFLRGKRFLCGRMRRCKVNGKRIRSAGNPETEPVFAHMDPMPLTNEPILNIHTVSSDVSEEEEDDPYLEEDTGRAPVGPVAYKALSFPFKLQALLDLLELKGESSVLSWMPHGRAFRVHDPSAFVRGLLPRFLGMSKFSSFHRQLLLYGFTKCVANSADKGAYYHPSFIRGMPRLCREMKRTSIINGTETRNQSLHEPDFYSMPAIPAVEAGLLELPLEMPDLPAFIGVTKT